MFFKVEDLLSSIKTRTLAPISQQTFTDANLITLANEELQISLVPDLISLREDFFLRSKTVSLVADVDTYPVPERSAGNALKKLFYIDSTGSRYSLPRTSIEALETTSITSGIPAAFILEGDEVKLLPAPAAGMGSLEFWYLSRPNELVGSSSVTKITAVASVGGTTTFTVDTDLTGSLAVGDAVDFLNAQSPFLLWAEDVVITAINSTTVEVVTSSVTDRAGSVQPGVNDYICPAQKANIPMIPQEFHPILAQMVASRLMEALGDIQKLQAVNAKLGEMRKQAFQIVSNRVESDSVHIVKRRGILRHSG